MTEDVSVEGFDELNRRLDAIGNPRQALGRIGLQVVARAKELVPRQTGNLGRTIRLGQVTETNVQVIAGGQAGVGYAQFVELGTRPHIIRPRNKKMLAWGKNRRLSGSARSGSEMIFAHEVHHPGTRAQPYIMPAAQEVVAKSGMDELVVKPWNDAA
jgi:hypothetical protein